MKITGIFSLFLGLTLFTGCHNKRSADAVTLVEFQEISYDKIATVEGESADDFMNGDGTLHLHGELTLPIRINNNDITELRDSLISRAGVEINSKGEALPKVEPVVKFTDISPEKADPSTEDQVTMNIDVINSKLIVWEINYYSYMGGAHGYGYATYLNYSILENKELTLADIFKPGFEKALNSLIRNNIPYEIREVLLADVNDIGYSTNFKISPGKIEFVYSPYEIAPYSEGVIYIPVYASQLDYESLLNPGVKESIFGV